MGVSDDDGGRGARRVSIGKKELTAWLLVALMVIGVKVNKNALQVWWVTVDIYLQYHDHHR